MQHVCTPAGKRALASALVEVAPDVLTVIQMLSRCLGGTSHVYVVLDDPDKMALLNDHLAAARQEHRVQKRAELEVKRHAAAQEIAAIKRILDT